MPFGGEIRPAGDDGVIEFLPSIRFSLMRFDHHTGCVFPALIELLYEAIKKRRAEYGESKPPYVLLCDTRLSTGSGFRLLKLNVSEG